MTKIKEEIGTPLGGKSKKEEIKTEIEGETEGGTDNPDTLNDILLQHLKPEAIEELADGYLKDTSDDDVLRQVLLEQQHIQFGQRLAIRQSKAQEKGTEADTGYGNRIVSNLIPDVIESIERWIEYSDKGAGRKAAALPIIQSLDLGRLAFLSIKIAVNGMSRPQSFTSIASKIGQAVLDEIHAQKARKKQSMTAYNAVMTKANKKTAPHRVRATAQFMWEQRGVIPRPERNAKILVSVGDALLNCVREATGLFHIERVRKGKGKTAQFIYTLVARAEYVTYMEDTLRLDQENGALHLPMTLKPLPWSQGRRGGYLSDFIPNTELVKTRNKDQRKRLNLANMPIVYEAANKAQETGYSINERIRVLMTEAAEGNAELGALPRSEDYPLPARPPEVDFDEGVLMEWKKRVSDVHETNAKLVGKRAMTMMVLKQAEDFSQYPTIYFPTQLDSRGRVYHLPTLNPQGADYQKALIRFSEGRRAGARGVYWSKVNIANLFGVDKVPFDDRVSWTEEHKAELLQCAEDPYAYRFWETADKPWQALAAIFSLQDIEMHGEEAM